MPFNSDLFRRAQFAERTETVEMPMLADFFSDGESPTFVVRGLTASELHKAIEAGKKNAGVDSLVKAIASQKEQVEQIRAVLGLDKDMPGEIVRRVELMVLGSVSPKLNHADVVKLAEIAPVEFMDLTNRITNLTGMGQARVKPQPSSLPQTD
jgi:hypothetical protein